jgi:uncharacterized integral membrane protein
MSELWLKIKIWTKGILAALVLLYVIIFIAKNSQPVRFWWWYNHEDQYSALVLIAIAFVAGIVSTVLFRTTLRTMRQVQDLRSRNRSSRLEREMADMKAKAAMLQTKPVGSTTGSRLEDEVDQTPLE